MRETVDIVTCDRCKHTTKNAKDASELDAVSSGLVQFNDLCPKCFKRVESLTDEMRAPKAQPKKANGAEE